MNTKGRQTCPLAQCDYTREDYSDLSALGWILHMQFHLLFGSAVLPEGVK
jgi:hypothetical protein